MKTMLKTRNERNSKRFKNALSIPNAFKSGLNKVVALNRMRTNNVANITATTPT